MIKYSIPNSIPSNVELTQKSYFKGLFGQQPGGRMTLFGGEVREYRIRRAWVIVT